MRKTLFLVVLVFVLALSVHAQSQYSKAIVFGVGATLGLPIGDDKDYNNLTWGIDLQSEIPIAPAFNILVNAGYIDFVGKTSDDTWRMIPVLVGGKFYLNDWLYGSLQAGLSFATIKNYGFEYSWTPAIGIKLSKKFDIALKYQSAKKALWDDSFIGLRLGYSF